MYHISGLALFNSLTRFDIHTQYIMQHTEGNYVYTAIYVLYIHSDEIVIAFTVRQTVTSF